MGLFGPQTEVRIENMNIYECSEPHHHRHFHDPHKRFRAFFSINKHHQKLLIMALTLNPGQTDVVGIEIYDSITGALLDKAVASGQQYAVDDTTILAIAPDADATKEDLTAGAAGTTNLSGGVTVDLSAYGLGNAVVLTVPPTPITVAPVVTVTPAARFSFAPPVTPATT